MVCNAALLMVDIPALKHQDIIKNFSYVGFGIVFEPIVDDFTQGSFFSILLFLLLQRLNYQSLEVLLGGMPSFFPNFRRLQLLVNGRFSIND